MAGDFPDQLGNIVYEYDYYGGSSVLCYCEDILIDDIVRIAWNVQQGRTPVYGYASQYYGALGAGTIIVNGSFWIGFKEAFYIPLILLSVARRRNPAEADQFFATPAITPERGTQFSSNLQESSRTWEGLLGENQVYRSGVVQRANIERLLQRLDNINEDSTSRRELAVLLNSLGAANDEEFEDIAEMFEDSIWYGGNQRHDGKMDAMSSNFAGGELTEERALSVRRADQFPPVDFLITFGDINVPAANHTVHRIVDLTITNTEFGGISATGEPIYVRYDFLARNVM